jgi:hypothetical protein
MAHPAGQSPLDDTVDLSSFDAEYSRTESAGPELVRDDIPDGYYEARIEDVRLSRTARTGNPMLVWRLRILGPACLNRTVSKSRVITEKTLRFLKEDLERFDIRLSRLSDLPHHLDAMLDKTVPIYKRTRDGWPDVFFCRSQADSAQRAAAPPSDDDDPLKGLLDDDTPF